jgi:TetR/AcrR family transcriptional repressor of bet genes
LTAEPARAPGRPSTGARERILESCLEVLKADGYAGLTIAKVAARAGDNKALVSYHFGSKQGLVAAAARELGETITSEIVAGIGRAGSVRRVVTGMLDAVWTLLERDARLARVYFDLNSVSVVEGEVRGVLREVKDGWRRVAAELLRDAGLPPARAETAAVMLIAGAEGLSLEWIERGDTVELRRARRLFVDASVGALGGSETCG